MEEKQQKATGAGCSLCGIAPFILGLVVALIFGWWAFPSLLYSEKQQPVYFSHKIHVENAGQTCADCHFLREDGSFSGLPSTAVCAGCHSGIMSEEGSEFYAVERDYVEKYVEQEKEVDWLVHQYQPDNVFFSHAAHMQSACANCHTEFDPENSELDPSDENYVKPDAFCNLCHPSVEELDKNLTFKEDRLTGYSKTTMKMWQCEQCHANPGHYGTTNSNNACYTCHK